MQQFKEEKQFPVDIEQINENHLTVRNYEGQDYSPVHLRLVNGMIAISHDSKTHYFDVESKGTINSSNTLQQCVDYILQFDCVIAGWFLYCVNFNNN